MMHDVLAVDIRGDVDQSGLNRLRTHLGLQKYGRLSDDWDQQFGYRKIERANGEYTRIALYRDFDGAWDVVVTDSEPTNSYAHDISALRQQLIDAIAAAGFEATARTRP